MFCALLLAWVIALAAGDTCSAGTQGDYRYCDECDGSDPQLCTHCYNGAVLEAGACLPGCNYTGSETNDFLVGHCLLCSTQPQSGALCDKCEEGYYVSDDQLTCLEGIACQDPAPRDCALCDSRNRCVKCAPQYKFDGQTCYADCPKLAEVSNPLLTARCLQCSEDGFCATCDTKDHYWSPEFGGVCVPKGCGINTPDGAAICSGHGTCSSMYYQAVCECEGEGRDPDNKCACRAGFRDDGKGACVASVCNVVAYPGCAACDMQGGHLVCTSCREGYYGTDIMCQQRAWENCGELEASNTANSMFCLRCNEGYTWGVVDKGCVPRSNLTAEQAEDIPNCAWVDEAGHCTKCKAGFSNLAANCSTACATAGCLRCSDSDPSVCEECYMGAPPNCIAVCESCGRDAICTADGKCTPKACVGTSMSYYDYVYGQYAAKVVCSGHGTCESGDSGEGASPRCACQGHYDPSTNCFACEEGYTKNGKGECVPADDSCGEHCASCLHGRCVTCKRGWSNVSGGCDTACRPYGCLHCSPNNPDECLVCSPGLGADEETHLQPPCQPVCEGCQDLLEQCAFASDGSGPKCVFLSCPANHDGVAYECNGVGTCNNMKCECPPGYSGLSCGNCASGYYRASNGWECLKATAEGCGQCGEDEDCAIVEGEPSCVPSGCIVGGTACNNAGRCTNAGLCKCSKPHFSYASACSACDEGYALVDGTCVLDNCLSGPHQVVGCAACVFEGGYLCRSCTDGSSATQDNHCYSFSSGGKKLGPGAIAGIVIAVIVVVALVVFLCVYFLVCRKRRQSSAVV